MSTTTLKAKTLADLEGVFKRCAERASMYDKENRFFQEDFEDLKEAGYLHMPLPEEFGGFGMSLHEVMQKQRELAYHTAPTALGINMHLYWVGLIADMWRSGDKSLEWVLKKAANGDILAAGHAESGNDVPVLWSTTEAKKVDGGYVFNGHKSFGSLGPVWTLLGAHGIDRSDPENPKIVHAFIPRDSKGMECKSTWDNVLGMRATRSDDTILKDTFVPDEYIARVVPAGFKGIDGFILGIFAWALMGFGNVYYGQAKRVFDMTIERLKKKKSIGITREYMAYHAGVQNDVADMAIELEGIGPHLDQVTRDWSEGVDHGAAWGLKLASAKYHAVEGSWKVVDKAVDLAGGFGIFPASGLERMFRDARLGKIHPTNSYLTKELMAKGSLGLDPDEQPRWG